MKLYKEYKNEQELQRREEEDRGCLEVPKETTIIYEQSSGMMVMRKICSILVLLLFMLVLGAMILFVTTNFK